VKINARHASPTALEGLSEECAADVHIVAIGNPERACAQSFAPWQQATVEITRRDHSRRHR